MSRATRHLLLSEYTAQLSAAAARYGADYGAVVKNDSATWSAPLGGVSLTIRLDFERDGGDRRMRPSLVVDESEGLPMDPLVALTVMADATATIHRAHAAYLSIHGGSVAVYDRDCPCTSCSGRGTRCDRCRGTGKRQEVPPCG